MKKRTCVQIVIVLIPFLMTGFVHALTVIAERRLDNLRLFSEERINLAYFLCKKISENDKVRYIDSRDNND
ncbi:MAG: hypothetical protein ACXU99_11565 [Thermodesulfobacteriota bacterium]